MELHKKEREKKHALALIRELSELWKQRNNIKPIKLEIPIQHGYIRTLELRDDVKNREDYLQILETIKFLGQCPAYHPNKDFITRVGKQKIEYHAGLKTVIDPRFRSYYTEDKRKSDIEKIKSINKYLSYHESQFTCGCREHKLTNFSRFRPHYSFKFQWMLTEVTKPHFLTHYTPIDSVLESKISKINQEMYQNNYYKLLEHRRVYDKIENEKWTRFKYGKDRTVIYHDMNGSSNDYRINGIINLPSNEGV